MYDLFSDFENLFSGFDALFGSEGAQRYGNEKKCPVCGHTWSDFRETGRFGCPQCYKTFREPVAETIRQIHSTSVHTGKVPSKSGESIRRKREYETLKAQLQVAVKNEDYETAAKLHKKIREIENNPNRGGDNHDLV